MNNSKPIAYRLLTGSTAGLITISFVWYLFRTSFAWEAIVGAIAWIIFYLTTILWKQKDVHERMRERERVGS